MDKRKIRKYLTEERDMTDFVASGIIEKLERHPDIMAEFNNWLEIREYPENGICVEGQTAKALAQSTYFSPIGAYNFLIFLRENPEEALTRLKAGLPRK